MGSMVLVLRLAVGARLYLQPTGSGGLVGIIHMEETEDSGIKVNLRVDLNLNRG